MCDAICFKFQITSRVLIRKSNLRMYFYSIHQLLLVTGMSVKDLNYPGMAFISSLRAHYRLF